MKPVTSQVEGTEGARHAPGTRNDRTGRDATIYQVARRAGVSTATVSRTLRGTAPVSDTTRERVLAAVQELQFTPSRPAQSLSEGSHSANGIVFPELSGPYFAEVILAYEEEAADLGRSVLILSTHGGEAAPAVVADLAARVDGIVVLGRTVNDDVLLDLANKGIPLVVIARESVPYADSVNAENDASAQALTAHLAVDHGYGSFEFLGDVAGSCDVLERWRGFGRELARLSIDGPGAPVRCALNEEGGRLAALELLSRKPPRALVCANDEIALGATLAAEALGLRVPEDMAITGWDDVMAARHSRPGLTTVRQPMCELGGWAARRLHERLAGDKSDPRHEVLPTQLVRRASCGPHLEEKA